MFIHFSGPRSAASAASSHASPSSWRAMDALHLLAGMWRYAVVDSSVMPYCPMKQRYRSPWGPRSSYTHCPM